MKIVSADQVRDRIARLMLADGKKSASIGTVVLRPHQIEGARRILGALTSHGGALLCDEVGVGKTFTAGAVIREFVSADVIAPAALLPMWRTALAATRLRVRLLSLEQFSRRTEEPTKADLVVIDEAHHLRNRNTARFINVATFVEKTRVLLLSATPVHNNESDLTSLLSLFLGSRADGITAEELSECVIRRRVRTVQNGTVPERVDRTPLRAPASTEIRDLLIALPSPVPPRGGDECAALLQFTLLRQWASSDAALLAGLRSRIARARALMSALEAGTFPTGQELQSWITGGSEIQLGFAGVLASTGGDIQLLAAVRNHADACSNAVRIVQATSHSDEWRVDRLREIRNSFPERKLIAFTQFASTAKRLFQMMKHEPKVALITSGRCEIASGAVSRNDVITRFAPIGSGVSPPHEREDISMLIATDICSEGLNLQDAGVVVHLDIPWTPARLEQRVGRIARTGSPYSEVFVHSFSVPAIADEILRIERRLRLKEVAAAELIGAQGATDSTLGKSVADANETLLANVRGWITKADTEDNVTVGAAVKSRKAGFVALIADGSKYKLICGDNESVTGDPRIVLQTIASFTCTAANHPELIRDVAERIAEWRSQLELAASLGVRLKRHRVTRNLTRKIDSLVLATPIHHRSRAATLSDRARISVAAPNSAGAQRNLVQLSFSDTMDEQWLEQLAASGRGKTKAQPQGSGFSLLAVLVGVADELCG